MTRRRWIADEFSADRAALTGAHAAHLARTLRARVGQEFEVACGDVVRRATVTNVVDDRVEFALGEEVSLSNAVPITLLLAVFKFDRMEWAIEKCTELNVNTIVPLIARRTEKHLAHAADKRVDRWRRIAREASEQSRRSTPPEITEPMKLYDALKACNESQAKPATVSSDTLSAFQEERTDELRPIEPRRRGSEFSPGRKPWVDAPYKDWSPAGTAQAEIEDSICGPVDLRIVLAETERTVTIADVLHANEKPQSLTLAVGPEGGWTLDELADFVQSGWISASLGETILRAETAAIAALAIARAELYLD